MKINTNKIRNYIIQAAHYSGHGHIPSALSINEKKIYLF